MKPLDNRQNKLHVWKEPSRPLRGKFQKASEPGIFLNPEPHSGGLIYGLLKDLLMATKIAHAARHCHLAAHNFDHSEPLVSHLKQRKPVLIIFDWDACESEAYKVLKEMNQNADFKSVANIGYVTGVKTVLREEAQRAGCHRVYHKTEFVHELDLILARYAV